MSLFASSATLTGVFNIIAVILAGINAAYKPSDKARNHASARSAFFSVVDRASFFAEFEVPTSLHAVAPDEYRRLREEYRDIFKYKTEVMSQSPYLNPKLINVTPKP